MNIMIDCGLLGLLVVLGTMGLWFWRAFQVNIPISTPYPYILLWAIGVALGIVALVDGTESGYASWAVGVGAFLLYTMFTGSQKVSDNMINVGDQIPVFTGVNDQDEILTVQILPAPRC